MPNLSVGHLAAEVKLTMERWHATCLKVRSKPLNVLKISRLLRRGTSAGSSGGGGGGEQREQHSQSTAMPRGRHPQKTKRL